MRHIFDLLFSVVLVVPVVVVVAAVLYAIIYCLARKRRENPTRGKMFCEYLLTAWAAMFLYIGQIKSFGNGMGQLYNIKPFQPFLTAFRYGLTNSGMVWQVLLNIIMFVPFGFLLAAVWKKCRTWPKILLISFLTTTTSELLQLISRQGTDIDDVIANTVGGLCGFAIYLICSKLMGVVKRAETPPPHFNRKLITGVTILCLTAIPFIAVSFADGRSQYGHLYYGHQQPTNVIVPASISGEATTGKVYQAVPLQDVTTLQTLLLDASGFQGEFKQDDNGFLLLNSSGEQIFIDTWGRWNVRKYSGSAPVSDPSHVPDEKTAVALAWEYLQPFGITAGTVSYDTDISEEYEDNNRHLRFASNETNADFMINGNISVTIGDDGKLITVSDNRIKCMYVADVPCISPRDAIIVAENVGVGEWNGTATVHSVEFSYTFIKETGYLIPVWQINADFIAVGGPSYKWEPVIDAVK